MIEVKCTGGAVISYDETIQPGELITAYHKGYFEFIRFENRGKKNTPLAHFKKRYRQDGTSFKTCSEDSCDASYCQRARQAIEKEIGTKQREIAALQQIISEIR